MKLLSATLLALLASIEAKPFTGDHRLSRRKNKLPGNLATACTDVHLHAKKDGNKYANGYSISAMCTDAEVKLDLNKCINNDNGKLAWSKDGGFAGSCKDCRPAGFWPAPFMTCSCLDEDRKPTEMDPPTRCRGRTPGMQYS